MNQSLRPVRRLTLPTSPSILPFLRAAPNKFSCRLPCQSRWSHPSRRRVLTQARSFVVASLAFSIQGCLYQNNPVRKVNFWETCHTAIYLELELTKLQVIGPDSVLICHTVILAISHDSADFFLRMACGTIY